MSISVKQKIVVRRPWHEVFDILKAADPEAFGEMTYDDVESMGSDPVDSSFGMIVFKEKDIA